MKPPGHTCPAINQVQHVLRQIIWRMDNPDKQTRQDARDLLCEGLALLEQVREENRQMRATVAHRDGVIRDLEARLAEQKP